MLQYDIPVAFHYGMKDTGVTSARLCGMLDLGEPYQTVVGAPGTLSRDSGLASAQSKRSGVTAAHVYQLSSWIHEIIPSWDVCTMAHLGMMKRMSARLND